MPALAYRDVLEQWDRSRAFGDPRDLTSFSNDLNTRTGTQDYSAGLRDGWWTRASTRADQYLFDPVANATTKPLGEAIGGLFGQPEAGGRVGTALPRALLETAPLYLLGPEAGIPATTAALGGTGALMAAHTYADTGSAKAAAISGITGAALPAIGRIGGNAFLKAFGIADRVAGELPALTEDASPRVFNDLYPKEGVSPTTFKLTRLAGSQTAMIAANQASMYATDKTLGQPYDPLSPDFWANQIPFTVFDLVHAAHGEVPTAEQMRTTRNAPVTEPESTYVPPPSDPVEQAQVEATLARFEVISQDPQATPEQKAGALSTALQTIADPKGVVQEKVAPKEQEVTLTGHGRLTEQGNFKMLVDPERSDKGLNIPDHGNVWINQNPQMQVTQNPDNTFTVKTPAKFVNGNVQQPLSTEHFAAKTDPNQLPLATQPEPWKGFGPDQQRTLEQHGVPPPTPEMPEDVRQHLRETVDKLEQVQGQQKETKAKIATVPKDAMEIPKAFEIPTVEAVAKATSLVGEDALRERANKELQGLEGMNPEDAKAYALEVSARNVVQEHQYEQIKAELKNGATPTQAVETARLVAQTPQLDASLELENLAKDILRKEKNRAKYDKGKPQRKYGEAHKDEQGKRVTFTNRADALEYQDGHPETQAYEIVNAGKTPAGKERGFYLAPVINKETSLDAPQEGGTLHGAIAGDEALDPEQLADESVATNLQTENVNNTLDIAEVPVDTRPSVSVQDVISTLERASREPKVMDELLDNQGDLAQTLKEISMTRKYLQAVANDENPTADAALARTVAKVTKATGMYTRKFRNWTMNSEMPFDEELVNQTKIRENPHAALIAFADNKESGVMGQFARDLANALPGLADVKVTFNPREGWNYDPNNQTINVGWLPSHENHMVAFGMDLAHEVAHHATRELMTRQDAAAVQFRGSLTKILEFTRKSPMLPDKVKATIKTAIVEDWYSDHIDAGETKNVLNNVKEGTSLFQRFQDAAGVENKQWYGAFYGLLNHEELVSTMFNDPDMVALLRATKMPQGFVKNALDFFTNAWAKVFGGKPETQSALGMLLQHFDNYLGGPAVKKTVTVTRPELPAGAGFLYSLAPYDPVTGKLGAKHTVPKSGLLSETQLQSMGGVGKPLTKAEVDLYKSLVPEAFHNQTVNLPKLYDGLRTKGPVVEVRKLGETSQDSNRLQEILHNVETRGYDLSVDGDNQIRGLRNRQTGDQVSIGKPLWQQVPEDLRLQVEEAQRLRSNEVSGRSENASHYSFLGPKPESEMPGYVEGLVRVPRVKTSFRDDQQPGLKEMEAASGVKYRGPHFGSEDTNVLSFYRGYEETLPDGTKAFHVIEVQSDWAQRNRDVQDSIKSGTLDSNSLAAKEPSHPLLRVYESLALKAAIAHAKEIGATKVILSDGETAMMTEGHDRAAQTMMQAPNGIHYAVAGQELVHAREKGLPIKTVVKQEQGMHLHYDQTLPSAMEKLTGTKGQPVDLGNHKFAREVVAEDVPEGADNPIKGSPVFRDATGAPKTQITGRVYDISSVEKEMPLVDAAGKVPQITKVQPGGYNGRDFIRDSLLFSGVRDTALTSRIDTVEKTFNTGNLADSIEGFRREAANGTLPATAESGSINKTIQDALVSGKPDDVTQGTLGLLMDEVPVHQELWRRMKQDLDLATRLYTSVKNGEVPGSIPDGLAENIKLSQVRLNAMAKALVKQELSIARLNDLNNFTSDGMQNTIVGQLMGRKLPGPNIDPTGLEPEAHELLALTRRTTARAELEKGKLQKTGEWLMRTFAMTQFMKQQIPEFRAVADNVQHEQGEAFVRVNRANFVYGADPDTQELDKKQIATNIRVEQNPNLARARSDISRWINVKEGKGEQWSLDDPFVKEVLGRSGDPKAVLSELNASLRRRQDDSQMVTPQNLSRLNQLVTAQRIVASEPGMKPDVGRDLAAEMYDAIAKMKDPATQQDGVVALRDVSTKMQAATFTKVFDLSNKLIQVAQNHLDLRVRTPGYVNEQRFDNYHVVMAQPDGKPYRQSHKTEALAKADIAEKEAKGYTFLDYVPKSDANVSGGIKDDVIKSMQELDTQVANALMESTKDDPNLYARFLPYTQRASDYAASAAAYDFVPGAAAPRRKFIAGREGINMVTNENLYYIKQNNWWRHKLIRAQSDLDMLDPDLAGNRTALQYSQQHVENQLSADNPLTRKIVEATYNWKLAWNFGVNFLHGIQSLTTGMASAIAETGSVGDAFGLTTKAQKSVIQRMTTGKWDTEDHKWLAQKLTATGNAGIASWTDIYGEDLATMYNANRATTVPGKGIEFIKNASRGWTGMFLKFNDQIGAIAGFDLARSRGMTYDDAFQFALDLKNRGYYTGGKQQRAVGLWSIKSKPVPQLMSSLQTYTFGWFSQLANNAINGFGTLPKGLTETQRLGAKKAFFYQLGAQAVLAGAIGLPGVGQGMALLKQTTGTDYKAWLRQHMADLFDEDQENGGIMTSLALHGLVATATPMDPSGRHIPTFPFIGVSPYKGFDVANLATAPVSSAADVVKGLMAAAKGDVEGASGLLPHVLQGPFNLWQGEGDVRDKHGNLVYQMSPSERFVTALGMTPSKVANAKDIAEAAKQASQAATQEKSRIIANLATTYRKQGSDVGRQAVTEYLQQHPDEKGPQFVAAIGRAVRDQTQPQDWRRTANPAGDYTGLSADYGVPVGETMGRNLQRGVEQSLGLNRRPDPRGDLQAQQIDEITASNPYLSRGEALRRVQEISPNRHRSTLQLSPVSQSPYQ